ncbi:MAG: hypothetical protein AAGE65_14835 [Planctomycetota bacterium]
MLVWLVPFFAVIAPGHQRGVLKTPGSDEGSIAVSAPNCALCAFVAGFGNSEPADDSVPPTNPAGDCAICHFNGTLLDPPPFELPDLRPERLDLPLAQAPATRPVSHLNAGAISQRGPPIREA